MCHTQIIASYFMFHIVYSSAVYRYTHVCLLLHTFLFQRSKVLHSLLKCSLQVHACVHVITYFSFPEKLCSGVYIWRHIPVLFQLAE